MVNVADVAFVIRRDRVDIYCNAINYVYLLPLIAHWRRLRIHCLPEAQVNIANNYKMGKVAEILTAGAHAIILRLD